MLKKFLLVEFKPYPLKLFLVAPSHELSDLSGHHSVRRYVGLDGWLFGWLSVKLLHAPPPMTPQKSSDLKNSKTKVCFTFFLDPPLPRHPSVTGIWYNTRFGLTYVWTREKIFLVQKIFFWKFWTKI